MREAMKQALEALELVLETDTKPKHEISKSITSLRQAIEQAEKQEPVAWRYRSVSPFVGKDGTYKVSDGWTLIRKPEKRDAHSAMCGMEAEPLYTTPPQRKPLTDEQIWEMDAYKMALTDQETRWLYRFARAIEAAHGIKE